MIPRIFAFLPEVIIGLIFALWIIGGGILVYQSIQERR